jgi:3-methyladenine DNA glycosylase/8-oxoguanine DNA glycosylase
MLRTDIFNSAILAITLQNAPIKRTDQMLQLLITNYGEKLTFDHKTTYTWPSPKSIMNADAEELTKKCKLGYRTKYLQSIAEAVLKQTCPTIKELLQMPFEKAKAELKKLKGIGEYSSEIILPHGEAFPIDIWSAQIFHKLFFPNQPLPPKQEAIHTVRKHAAERWDRWRRQAFVYVLSDLGNLSKKFQINL